MEMGRSECNIQVGTTHIIRGGTGSQKWRWTPFRYLFILTWFSFVKASGFKSFLSTPLFKSEKSRSMLSYSGLNSFSLSQENKQVAFQADWLGMPKSVDAALSISHFESTGVQQVENHHRQETAFPHSENQFRSIKCDAPAVLLKSGPGTGKTYALASRITKACGPEHIVVLSFTNRDARNLKEHALSRLFAGNSTYSEASGLTKVQVSDRLWSGTIHAFASSLIRAYGTSHRKLRIISNTETRMRVDRCLHSLLDHTKYNGNIDKLHNIRRIHRDALADLRQSRGMVMHQIGRCMELWKESGILTPPSIQGVKIQKQSEPEMFDHCIEVAMRLSISNNVARLAWEVLPEYQSMHETHGTADPSDIASLAYHLLLSSPKKLTTMRSKLKHVILDEYQDVSVAQHALIRLVIRGLVDEDERDLGRTMSTEFGAPPVLTTRKLATTGPKLQLSFDVPKLFCCGDPNQSIYGWRGAAPSISVDGFRKDYPQGIVVPLETSFRLTGDMWNAVNILADSVNLSADTVVQAQSPVSILRIKESLKARNEQHMAETLSTIIAADPTDDVTATVNIQGLWDAREEAKYIATRIQRRSKGRAKRLMEALRSVTSTDCAGKSVTDPSDVAIIVRSPTHMSLIKEALEVCKVPYVVCDSESDRQSPRSVYPNEGIVHASLMKPVSLMTMHRAKGEEFDEVYLPGWSEGEFPHPTAVSSNRVDEERRLAYVSISRARNRVVITHSFVRRELHHGSNLDLKRVAMQVKPSRFLYELVPDAQKYANEVVTNYNYIEKNDVNRNMPSVVWNRRRGSKEVFAGGNLPSYFSNSYRAPKNYSLLSDKPRDTIVLLNCSLETFPSDERPSPKKLFDQASTDEKLDKVLHGLNELAQGTRGAKTKYKIAFRAYLIEWFDITRGSIPTYMDEWTLESSIITTVRLKQVFMRPLTKRAISQCSATQLGLFLALMLL
jgi:superfamily I DNA/RNA helicase